MASHPTKVRPSIVNPIVAEPDTTIGEQLAARARARRDRANHPNMQTKTKLGLPRKRGTLNPEAMKPMHPDGSAASQRTNATLAAALPAGMLEGATALRAAMAEHDNTEALRSLIRAMEAERDAIQLGDAPGSQSSIDALNATLAHFRLRLIQLGNLAGPSGAGQPLGRLARLWRARRGMTIPEAAEALGLTREQLSRLEADLPSTLDRHSGRLTRLAMAALDAGLAPFGGG